jgi:hypothetical protein
MTRLAEAVGTSQHYAKLNLTLAASTQYTYSIYAKAAEVRYLSFEVDDGVANGAYVTFDLQTGGISQALTAIGAAVVGAATIVPVGGGVYHCSATTSLATGTAASILWQTSNVPAPGQYATYAGNPANGLSIWGAQIELGAFATSYIPTTGTTVTRAVDLASMPFTPTASGTWQAKFIPSGIASGLPYIISGNAGSPAMAIGADSRLVASIRGGASVFSGITPAMTFNAVNKAAFGWLTGGSKAAVNGTLLGANAVALAVTGTSVQLGSDGVTPGNNALNGGLQSIQYWPRQLSDVEMQQVTT